MSKADTAHVSALRVNAVSARARQVRVRQGFWFAIPVILIIGRAMRAR